MPVIKRDELEWKSFSCTFLDKGSFPIWSTLFTVLQEVMVNSCCLSLSSPGSLYSKENCVFSIMLQKTLPSKQEVHPANNIFTKLPSLWLLKTVWMHWIPLLFYVYVTRSLWENSYMLFLVRFKLKFWLHLNLGNLSMSFKCVFCL